jgi:hypothetical protein
LRPDCEGVDRVESRRRFLSIRREAAIERLALGGEIEQQRIRLEARTEFLLQRLPQAAFNVAGKILLLHALIYLKSLARGIDYDIIDDGCFADLRQARETGCRQ